MRLEEVNNRLIQEKPNEDAVDQLLNEEQRQNRKKIVVLDDDPTGTQTVHDISVYTDWSVKSLKQGFAESNSLFYILTNSRALTENQTAKLHLELTDHLIDAAKETGKGFIPVSRSDSTLRGHYPLETERIRQVIETRTPTILDGEVLFPFFREGGRYTVDNIHYVEENGALIPAAETEYAKDKTFGYKSSNLCDYIQEKTHGKYLAKDTIPVSLESLRRLEIGKIISELCSAHDFAKIIVNAIDYIDVKVFCIALFRAMATGRNYLIRCAASFVRAFGGIRPRPLLTKEELIKVDHPTGGLIIIGSYTGKTTKQMERLKTIDRVHFIEFNTNCVLEPFTLEEIARTADQTEEALKEGRTAAIFTNRQALSIAGDTREDILVRSVKISEALCDVVKKLRTTPNFILAKGGITSSDIAVKALGIKRAKVLGQISPGIPVWETDSGSMFRGVPYIIFPGNVGKTDTLSDIVRILLGEKQAK